MINLIVIEDEKKIQDKIKEIIRDAVRDKGINPKKHFFNSFNNELKELMKNESERKIYIIDIELGTELNGIHIAKMIRETDWDSEIIFITNHDKMFETVYRSVLKVFNFIEKFHNFDERLKEDLETILNKTDNKKMFVYKSKNADIQIYYKSINYIVRDKEERKIIIHYDDKNKVKLSLNLNEAIELLDDRFRYSHRSCIVNKENVVEFNWTKGYFILTNGKKIDLLSKTYREEIER